MRVSTDRDVSDKPPGMDSQRPSHYPPSARRFWVSRINLFDCSNFVRNVSRIKFFKFFS